MKTRIDYDLVQRSYRGARFIYPDTVGDPADRFRPAYFVTNEYLENTIRCFGNNNGDVLTVAASGDQPLLYAAYGARNIDTFDLTYCARAIMDIKCAAARKFNRDEYINFLLGVNRAQWDMCDIMSAPGMRKIVNMLPRDSAEFIRRVSDCHIFSAGGYAPGEIQRSVDLGPNQWRAMQKNMRAPFNFIWSDIADLHTHLTKKYDVINTSNIFEWMYQESVGLIVPTMKNLFGHLKPGGYVFGTTVGYRDKIVPLYQDAAYQLGGQCVLKSDKFKRETLLALQRTR